MFGDFGWTKVQKPNKVHNFGQMPLLEILAQNIFRKTQFTNTISKMLFFDKLPSSKAKLITGWSDELYT